MSGREGIGERDLTPSRRDLMEMIFQASFCLDKGENVEENMMLVGRFSSLPVFPLPLLLLLSVVTDNHYVQRS